MSRNLVRAAVRDHVAMQLPGHNTRAVFERDNIVGPGAPESTRTRESSVGSSGVMA